MLGCPLFPDHDEADAEAPTAVKPRQTRAYSASAFVHVLEAVPAEGCDHPAG